MYAHEIQDIFVSQQYTDTHRVLPMLSLYKKLTRIIINHTNVFETEVKSTKNLKHQQYIQIQLLYLSYLYIRTLPDYKNFIINHIVHRFNLKHQVMYICIFKKVEQDLLQRE